MLHFLAIRDPRDILVSDLHFVSEMAYWHPLHTGINRFATKSDQLDALIHGFEYKPGLFYPNIQERLAEYLSWLDSPDVCVVRFEDLTGENAGQAIKKMNSYFASRATWIDPNIELDCKVETIIDPRKSKTFRSGKTGGWRKEFQSYHCTAFEQLAGSALERLGYE
ncbi:sulfotransferase domain-containing protein [Rhodopirellula sp. ICT_H3.1]|uniref:Sulfotransferase domain-containing protein n=2 Tax=Aporhodopirellula aestuarii TaxID=2950107 RepID=A0ABT0U777_9BACT|nr:sulfotransferase domain-containing protein [Aporhodopirellula aestuarii]